MPFSAPSRDKGCGPLSYDYGPLADSQARRSGGAASDIGRFARCRRIVPYLARLKSTRLLALRVTTSHPSSPSWLILST